MSRLVEGAGHCRTHEERPDRKHRHPSVAREKAARPAPPSTLPAKNTLRVLITSQTVPTRRASAPDATTPEPSDADSHVRLNSPAATPSPRAARQGSRRSRRSRRWRSWPGSRPVPTCKVPTVRSHASTDIISVSSGSAVGSRERDSVRRSDWRTRLLAGLDVAHCWAQDAVLLYPERGLRSDTSPIGSW